MIDEMMKIMIATITEIMAPNVKLNSTPFTELTT
jgi:hypothetical protein